MWQEHNHQLKSKQIQHKKDKYSLNYFPFPCSFDYISYDLQNLIGEVGGTLGLTIGLSFFSITEYSINVIKYFIHKL